MYVATIRNHETRTAELEGTSLEDIAQKAEMLCPAGFEVVSVPVQMKAGSTEVTAVVTFVRRDEEREITGATLDEIQAQTPEGWQPLFVLTV